MDQGQALGVNRGGDQKGTRVDVLLTWSTKPFDLTYIHTYVYLQLICETGPVSRSAGTDARDFSDEAILSE